MSNKFPKSESSTFSIQDFWLILESYFIHICLVYVLLFIQHILK